LKVQASLGDKNQNISLLNGQAPDDFFTRELDQALLKGEADVAIHSAKDLPEQLNGGLEVIALYEAFDKTDALVSRDNQTLETLPAGSRIGTSSPLRKQELLAQRPDLEVVGIRGCIEDRVQQVRSGQIDAAIVATCALKRLGMENEIAEILSFATHPMQGRLAVTARKGRNDLKEIFSKGSIL
jgi:hydroxymethylbilane synthase